MRLLVTGGRHYNDRETIFSVLDRLDGEGLGIASLAHGACPTGSEERPHGADWQADVWGRENGLEVGKTLLRYPAVIRDGRFLGPERNGIMIDNFRPDVVVAFTGGRGTRSCVAHAFRRGVRIIRVPASYLTNRLWIVSQKESA